MSRRGILDRMQRLAQFVGTCSVAQSDDATQACPTTLTVEQDGVVISVTGLLGKRALPSMAHPSAAPTAETKPWRTRGGRLVQPQELVDAIRHGWPGTKELCGRHRFDTHTTAMAAWLKQCVAARLLVRDGKGYALGPAATGVAL
jgi:hypothetical protein